jgi:hypothetical protein
MTLLRVACLALFASACTVSNPAWVGNSAAAVPDAASAPTLDFAAVGAPDAEVVVVDMATQVAPDLAHPIAAPDLSPAPCKSYTSQTTCQAGMGCYWLGNKCRDVNDKITNCGLYMTQPECVIEADCEWQQYADFGQCVLAF